MKIVNILKFLSISLLIYSVPSYAMEISNPAAEPLLLSIANQSEEAITAFITTLQANPNNNDLITIEPYEDKDNVILKIGQATIYTPRGMFTLAPDDMHHPKLWLLSHHTNEGQILLVQKLAFYDVNNIVVIVNPNGSISIVQGDEIQALEKINAMWEKKLEDIDSSQIILQKRKAAAQQQSSLPMSASQTIELPTNIQQQYIVPQNQSVNRNRNNNNRQQQQNNQNFNQFNIQQQQVVPQNQATNNINRNNNNRYFNQSNIQQQQVVPQKQPVNNNNFLKQSSSIQQQQLNPQTLTKEFPMSFSNSKEFPMSFTAIPIMEKIDLMQTLTPYLTSVQSICFSPDSTTLATGSAGDKVIKLWNIVNGVWTCIANINAIDGYANNVTALCFSPDNLTLASAFNDGSINFWNIVNGLWICTSREKKHVGLINSICFNPNGTILASGAGDGVKLSNIVNGKSSHQAITLIKSPIRLPSIFVCFSPDGLTLASSSNSRNNTTCISLWNVVTHRGIALLSVYAPVNSVCYSPDGLTLAAGLQNKTTTLWNIVNGKWTCTATLGRHTEEVKSVCFSPDGTILATGSMDTTIKLWKYINGSWTCIITLENGSPVNSICFSPDGKFLASASYDGTVKLWNIRK